MTGMLRSIRTMSGRHSRYFSSASSPLPACATTSRPGSVERNDTRPARMSWWSSAARILIVETGMRMMIRRATPKPHTQKEVAPDAGGTIDLATMPAQSCRRTLLFLIAAATAAPAASAQEPGQTLSQLYHTAWTVREGAPAAVEALTQTADGFLWLGSGTGLTRFDGVRFELYAAGRPVDAIHQCFGAGRSAGQRSVGRLSLRRRQPDPARHDP